MNDRALNHTLKAGGRLHVEIVTMADNRGKFGFDVISQAGTQLLDIHLAGRQNFERITVFGQREKQMFQRGKFMRFCRGRAHGPAQGLLKFS